MATGSLFLAPHRNTPRGGPTRSRDCGRKGVSNSVAPCDGCVCVDFEGRCTEPVWGRVVYMLRDSSVIPSCRVLVDREGE